MIAELRVTPVDSPRNFTDVVADMVRIVHESELDSIDDRPEREHALAAHTVAMLTVDCLARRSFVAVEVV
jgi:hypothetical protein